MNAFLLEEYYITIIIIMTLICTLFSILLLNYLFYPAIVVAKSVSSLSRQIKPITIYQPPIIAAATTRKEGDSTINCNDVRPILSLIIPAYDEESRLPKMLNEAYTYLSEGTNCKALQDMYDACQIVDNISNDINKEKIHYIEWIVVSDGSKDKTTDVYREFVNNIISSNNDTTNIHIWKLIAFPNNEGKGAAVQAGMLSSSGHFCLMVDADGATTFNIGLENLTSQLLLHLQKQKEQNKNQQSYTYPILFGSRAHLRDNNNNNNNDGGNTVSSMGRQLIRTILSEVFHYCALICVGANNIRDTQCGFKLLSSIYAKNVFNIIHLRRWAFDTELVYVANQLHYQIIEVPVPWHEVEGSKLHTSALNLATVSIGMLRDMICVRLCYTLGLWKINQNTSTTNNKKQL